MIGKIIGLPRRLAPEPGLQPSTDIRCLLGHIGIFWALDSPVD
jgi:hypothetical protein